MKASAMKTSRGRYKPRLIRDSQQWGYKTRLLPGNYLTREEAVAASQRHIDAQAEQRNRITNMIAAE